MWQCSRIDFFLGQSTFLIFFLISLQTTHPFKSRWSIRSFTNFTNATPLSPSPFCSIGHLCSATRSLCASRAQIMMATRGLMVGTHCPLLCFTAEETCGLKVPHDRRDIKTSLSSPCLTRYHYIPVYNNGLMNEFINYFIFQTQSFPDKETQHTETFWRPKNKHA